MSYDRSKDTKNIIPTRNERVIPKAEKLDKSVVRKIMTSDSLSGFDGSNPEISQILQGSMFYRNAAKALNIAGYHYVKDLPNDKGELLKIKGIGNKTADFILKILGELK